MSGGKVQVYSTGSYVYILVFMSGEKFPEHSTWVLCVYVGPMSGWKVPDNSTGLLCVYPGPYVRWEGPRIKYCGPIYIYISWALCQVGMSQSIVLGSNVYILGPMSGVKVPECSIGVLCIYPGPYVNWEGSRVYFWVSMYISRALCQMRRYKSIVLGCYVYIMGHMPGGIVQEYNMWFLCINPGPYVLFKGSKV